MNAVPAATPATPPTMDLGFILRNQIVERYLAGRLPLRGQQDFENYCREHPEMLDELGLPTQINAGLRLLDSGGRPTPWEDKPQRLWDRPVVRYVLLGAAVVLAVIALTLTSKLSASNRSVHTLTQKVQTQPLEPATATRTVILLPSRTAPSRRPAVALGGINAQLADLKVDVSWSPFTNFRVSVDRIDQGRVAVIYQALRDSNGQVHLALNTSALGPGLYQLTLEGLTWKGETVPQAWVTVEIVH